jgi:SAM-dependent methyltransferase
MWRHIDRLLGRGAYPVLRQWIAPEREAVQEIYPRLVADALRTRGRWLDAGCGHTMFEGRFVRYEALAMRLASLVVGCDAAVASLRRHRTVTRLAASTLDRLPFRDGSFDLVTLHWVVEHLDDPVLVFREIARVLAPGGLVILRTPNASSYYIWLARLGMHVLPKACVDRLILYMQHRDPVEVFPTRYRANSRRSLVRAAREAGLVVSTIQLFADQPLFYCVAPLAVIELTLVKAAVAAGLRDACSDTIVAVLRRPLGSADRRAPQAAGAGTIR